MSLPRWVPIDLFGCWETSKPEIERRRSLSKKLNSQEEKRTLSVIRRHIEEGDIDVGLESPSVRTTFAVLEVLITNPQMETVWKALNARTNKFTPRANAESDPFPSDDLRNTFDTVLRRYPGMKFGVGGARFSGQVNHSLDLFITCVAGMADWMNTPRFTRAESSELLLEVGRLAGELRASILKIRGPERQCLWNIVKYLDDYDLNCIASGARSLSELPKHEQQNRLRDLRIELEVLPRIPVILLELKQQAELFASQPNAVRQPNRRDAETNHFIRYLSNYFVESYGTPLNAHVATITNVIFDTEVTEDKVRSLIRLDKSRAERESRKKKAPNHKKTGG